MANPLPGNPHAEETLSQYHYIGESWMSEEGMTDATMVAGAIHTQALATLALAHEQRTANLIAAAPYLRDMDCPNLAVKCEKQLAARLGLDGEQA